MEQLGLCSGCKSNLEIDSLHILYPSLSHLMGFSWGFAAADDLLGELQVRAPWAGFSGGWIKVLQPPLTFTLLSSFSVTTPSHTAQQELLHAYRKGWNWQMNTETFLTQKLQRGLIWETGRRLCMNRGEGRG